jgi:hypothetical protein
MPRACRVQYGTICQMYLVPSPMWHEGSNMPRACRVQYGTICQMYLVPSPMWHEGSNMPRAESNMTKITICLVPSDQEVQYGKRS